MGYLTWWFNKEKKKKSVDRNVIWHLINILLQINKEYKFCYPIFLVSFIISFFIIGRLVFGFLAIILSFMMAFIWTALILFVLEVVFALVASYNKYRKDKK